jgi:phenylalanyl-tRNA synthetase alpha chain
MPASEIDSLRTQFEQDIAGASTESALRAVRDRYLSRKGGLVSALLKSLGTAPAHERPQLGQRINALKQDIETTLDERLTAVEGSRPPAGAVDVTLPGRRPVIGHRHPLTILRERIEAIFTRMGFLVIEGPELEDDYHNFEALNMPPEHPARDMQDTLYLSSPVRSAVGAAATLLRTHTSGMQIRHMEEHTPPVRLIAPGRVYRRDQFDLTHTPMFTQVEGLVVGEGISLGDLKGTLFAFARELFGADRQLRLRPSFFPYTEPSAELDISCAVCGGTGRLLARAGSSNPGGRGAPGDPGPVPPKPGGRGTPGEGGPVPPKPGGRGTPGEGGLVPPKPGERGTPGEGGCAMCKRTGWLEILGSGMVHPAVFEAVGYDPERYTGWAFGMGIERVALLKWGVEDIRLFYENDLRFLEQFPL